ncbi:MAG: HK97 family phage prohead protease [Hyphomicrobiales bacterium]|nr:MAG: HK97 family phage prohead protease [Hyphomicrobiales bacterium]
MERRALQIELRAAGSNPRRLEGYAATFGVETRIGDFVESIQSGAFASSLASGRDVLALVDHDPSRVLGRTKSGTLRLVEDTRGLHFSLDLPDTQAARDVLALAERGDIGGASFGFKVAPAGEAWRGNRRELRAVNLHEISIVQSWPAYSDTTVEARSHFANLQKVGLRPTLGRWRA